MHLKLFNHLLDFLTRNDFILFFQRKQIKLHSKLEVVQNLQESTHAEKKLKNLSSMKGIQ